MGYSQRESGEEILAPLPCGLDRGGEGLAQLRPAVLLRVTPERGPPSTSGRSSVQRTQQSL